MVNAAPPEADSDEERNKAINRWLGSRLRPVTLVAAGILLLFNAFVFYCALAPAQASFIQTCSVETKAKFTGSKETARTVDTVCKPYVPSVSLMGFSVGLFALLALPQFMAWLPPMKVTGAGFSWDTASPLEQSHEKAEENRDALKNE
jgi:hypothetical protein